MKIGITGHQERKGIDWMWVRETMRRAFSNFDHPIEAYGSLAEGADQIFAELALEVGAQVFTLVPKDDYIKHYRGDAKAKYLSLLSQSHVINLSLDCPDEDAFLIAGKKISDTVDTLFAVWDGEPAQGKGGTADIVEYARARGTSIVHIDPTTKELYKL